MTLRVSPGLKITQTLADDSRGSRQARRIQTEPCFAQAQLTAARLSPRFPALYPPLTNTGKLLPSSSRQELSLTRTTFGIAGIPAVISMVCAALPLPARLPAGPWVSSSQLNCTFRRQPKLSASPFVPNTCSSSDGDALPINRKGAQTARLRSVCTRWAKTRLGLHCKMFPQLFTDASDVNRDLSEAKR